MAYQLGGTVSLAEIVELRAESVDADCVAVIDSSRHRGTSEPALNGGAPQTPGEVFDGSSQGHQRRGRHTYRVNLILDRKPQHDRRHPGPEMQMLVRVEMRGVDSGLTRGFDLGIELARQVVRVDAATNGTPEERLPGPCETPLPVDQRADLVAR